MERVSSSGVRRLAYKHIRLAARESAKYIDDRRKGLIKSLRTPWRKYNAVSMGGIEWYTIHTIAGMSGSGKTAILNQLETELARLNPDENFSILSFNFEMLARNLVSRKFSAALEKSVQELHSGIPGEVLSDEDYARVLEEGKKIANLNVYYVDSAGSVQQIVKTILDFAAEPFNEGKGIVVLLDHTILVHGKAGDKEREVLVELMTAFNGLKKHFHSIGKKISFVLLSQLNREIEHTDRVGDPSQQFPKKKDIFGGDAVYQFSDVVMVTMNPEQMGLEVYGPKAWPTEGFLYWHFLKVREGQPIVAAMKNKLKYNRVEDYVRPKMGYEQKLDFDSEE